MDEDLGDPEIMKRILDEFNQSTLDPVGPFGGEQGMKVLSKINSLVDDHDAFVRNLAPIVNVL